VLTFDDRSIAPQHLFEVFHDTTAPLFDTAPMSDGASCRCAATDYLVDDLVVSKLSYDAQTFRRRRAHVRDGASDWITLQVYRRGGIRGSIGDGREIAIDASNVGVVDLSLPFAVYSEPSVVIWVGFPRDRLERADELAALGEAPTWSLDSTRGRALVASATDLWERLGAARPEDAGDLAGEITDTVNRVLRPGHFAPTDHGRRLAIKEFIAANLDDLDLNVDTVRAAFHYSRSSIYRLFDSEGGIARYIREQRLLRCFDELTQPGRSPRVREVATRWGFDNPSHFHRLFTRRFGLAPSNLAAARRARSARERVDDPILDQMIGEFHAWAAST
jgi:AraC-like DNA-binding protein